MRAEVTRKKLGPPRVGFLLVSHPFPARFLFSPVSRVSGALSGKPGMTSSNYGPRRRQKEYRARTRALVSSSWLNGEAKLIARSQNRGVPQLEPHGRCKKLHDHGTVANLACNNVGMARLRERPSFRAVLSEQCVANLALYRGLRREKKKTPVRWSRSMQDGHSSGDPGGASCPRTQVPGFPLKRRATEKKRKSELSGSL